MARRPLLSALTVVLVAAGGCGAREVPAADLGRDRFGDPRVSTSRFNTFACATCHTVDATAGGIVPERLDPGSNLAGAATRGAWWGNGAATLLDAMNVCLKEFMGGRALTREDDAARELDAYLEANPSTDGAPVPFTVISVVSALADRPGDPGRGSDAYRKACRRCHGEAHTGDGRITAGAVIVPEATQATFPSLAREATVEKVRHGRFFNIGGVMPLYTAEAMTDETLADILAYLGL